MFTITFKAKPFEVTEMGSNKVVGTYVKVPSRFKRSHCNMAEASRDPKHGMFSNSNMWEGIATQRAYKKLKGKLEFGDCLNLDLGDPDITIKQGSLLATVSLKV